mmetsp:Transcript_14404/g.48177  ORF Transcript_14404/g.48177 Transcript_14404/m.48177 type:complete len:279 (+) Transcript_14404:442-1278(+)
MRRIGIFENAPSLGQPPKVRFASPHSAECGGKKVCQGARGSALGPSWRSDSAALGAALKTALKVADVARDDARAPRRRLDDGRTLRDGPTDVSMGTLPASPLEGLVEEGPAVSTFPDQSTPSRGPRDVFGFRGAIAASRKVAGASHPDISSTREGAGAGEPERVPSTRNPDPASTSHHATPPPNVVQCCPEWLCCGARMHGGRSKRRPRGDGPRWKRRERPWKRDGPKRRHSVRYTVRRDGLKRRDGPLSRETILSLPRDGPLSRGTVFERWPRRRPC